MPLSSPYRTRERILMAGLSGSGKSRAWMSIARRIAMTKGDAHFYAIDTDAGSIDAMVERGFPDLADRITVFNVFEWGEYVDAVDQIRAKVKPDDWLTIDMIHPAWDAVQGDFSQRLFKKSLADYFLAAREQQKKGAFEGFTDWPVIKAQYFSWINTILWKTKCHVFATAGVKGLGDRDNQALRSLWGIHGVRPRGQEDLTHQFHTAIYAKCRVVDEDYIITKVKDRERPPYTALQVTDFAKDYLVGIAGWSPL